MATNSDINAPATLAEIARITGVEKRTMEIRSKKWACKPTVGANRQHFYALKDLPKELRDALINHRLKLGDNKNEQERRGSNPAITGHSGGNESGANQRHSGFGQLFNDSPAVNLATDKGGVVDNSTDVHHLKPGRVDKSRPVKPVRNRTKGAITDQGARADAADKTGTEQRGNQVEVNGKGAIVRHISQAKPAGNIRLFIDDTQRLKDGARQTILRFIDSYPGTIPAACEFLTKQYAANELNSDLVHAIENCNDKANAQRRGIISIHTVCKWSRMRRDNGHCLPAKTRVKADWRQVWWFRLFLSCYQKPQKPKITEAMADFKEDWMRQGLPMDDLPSYDTVNRLVKSMSKIDREKGRMTGAEMGALKPFIRRNWKGDSNEVWVGDGHSFKAKVKHPETGRAFAPEVTVIIDAASRFIVGWAFSLSENVIAVSEALGQAMLKHGKPLIYYSDNGSGQTAKPIDCEVGGMMARMDIDHQTGIPGNAQGRGLIEGLWDITAIAAAKTFPTFQGTGMDGDTLRKVTNAINSAKRKGETPDFVPDWHWFMATCEEYFDTYNHEHKHSSLSGKTPAEVYFANFNDAWHRPLTEDEQINLFRPFVERTPTRGEVKWINNIYFHKDLACVPDKTKVRVAYDMHHPDYVWISDLKGVFICKAEWNGNMVDGFAKSYKQQLKDTRIDNIVKRKMEGVADALAEREDRDAIDGEVLRRIEVIPQETLPPLVRVAPIAKEVEEPSKPVVIKAGFSKQEPEERTMTRLETLEWIKEQGAKNKGQ
ncbi:MAG: Mu transposase C-terminal domain-containing protein [Rhodocyclaceae bacterium]|nr:Mu transposase C-terminal domain-containing protein [Rhodocyclaceae bacterium]